MSDAAKIAVILPAAGMSRRFKMSGGAGHAPGLDSGGSKLDVSIGGRAAIVRAVELFAGRKDVCRIVIAVDPDGVDAFKFKYADKLGLLDVKIVAGGRVERWETVRNALAAVADTDATHIAVHDAARPVAESAMIDRVFAAASRFDAVIPAVPVHATVKRVGTEAAKFETASGGGGDALDAIFGGGEKETVEAYPVLETIPRDGLWLVQTPQVFERSLLERAYAGIAAGKVDAKTITDDAGLVEAMGERVMVVPGDAYNVKITVPADVAFAEAVVAMRSGSGKDLGPKRKHATWAQMDDD